MGGRHLHVNAAAGVAGDMLLGALIDAGADPLRVMADLGALGVDGFAVTFERTQRGGIAATWANVAVHDRTVHEHGTGPGHHDTHDAHDHPHDHPHRPAAEVRRLIEAADLAEPVRRRAVGVVDALARAEGEVHGVDPDEVLLHEVGALDAIVDVVGIASALTELEVGTISVAPLAMGHGAIDAAHGRLPNPPPAVVRLLASRRVPVVGVDTGMELSTPTGVAALVALADTFGPMPAMTVERVGYGAGRADPPGRPNVVQVVLGPRADGAGVARPGRRAVQLEANVDDVTGEVLAHTIAALMAAGAHDAWVTPIVMKKGRPAHTVSALADPAQLDRIAAVLVAETGTLGVRAFDVERWPQSRTVSTVVVDGHPIGVKVTGQRVKVEHNDAAAAAAALARPLREVMRRAEAAAQREHDAHHRP